MGRVRGPLLGSVVIVVGLLLVLSALMNFIGQQSSTAGRPVSTPTLTIGDWDSQVANDAYAAVAKYPGRYLGQAITWTCNLANFFGHDTPDGKDNIGCWEFEGQYDGQIGDGELVLSLPGSLDISQLNAGDDLIVRGTIAAPYDGLHPPRRAYAGPVIDVWSLVDQGHDPNAS